MRVIPVIDLMGGRVVRAVGGDRLNYRPIETPLAPGTSDPSDIAAALSALYPAGGPPCLYIADLDAITGAGPGMDEATLAGIRARVPGVPILIDRGFRSPADLEAVRHREDVRPVLATEALRDTEHYCDLCAVIDGPFALSLDWRGEEPIGAKALFADAALWPDEVIVMTLGRVGSRSGPDTTRLAAVKSRSGSRRVLAAGGVRGGADLERLDALGCDALVATALHDGSITAGDLARLNRWP